MDYDKIDAERRAIYGFHHGISNYKGWLSRLFEESTLYPYLNLLRQEVRDLLYKKSLFGKVVPAFSKHLRISNLVNTLIGLDIFKPPSKGESFVDELASIILEDLESRKSLNSRIENVQKKLRKQRLYISGLSYPIHGQEEHPTLRDLAASADGKFVSLEGLLNHVEAIGALNPALEKSFSGSGISWILSDFPFFSMVPDNPNYDGNVVAVAMDDKICKLLEGSVPFRRTTGWYPYVRVFGTYRSSISPKFSSIGVIEWCWMMFRRSLSFEDIPNLLDIVLHDQHHRDNAYLPWLDTQHSRDIFLFLSAIQLAYEAHGLKFEDVRPDIRALAEEALKLTVSSAPQEITTFFSNA